MATAYPVVPQGLLLMHYLQRRFSSFCLDSKRQKQHKAALLEEVQFWESCQHVRTGAVLGQGTLYKTLFTDVSGAYIRHNT